MPRSSRGRPKVEATPSSTRAPPFLRASTVGRTTPKEGPLKPHNLRAQGLDALIATMDGRADSTATLLRQQAENHGMWISADGRIGEADLATLIGIAPGTLANKRREGTAPESYSLGGGKHKITYRLIDAARWLEAHRK